MWELEGIYELRTFFMDHTLFMRSILVELCFEHGPENPGSLPVIEHNVQQFTLFVPHAVHMSCGASNLDLTHVTCQVQETSPNFPAPKQQQFGRTQCLTWG